ncbi:MAG: hypothetical protein K9G61_01540 [Bacteroidales bacterium]|nr:hypothetical protein [Bacteroidales bacterium]
MKRIIIIMSLLALISVKDIYSQSCLVCAGNVATGDKATAIGFGSRAIGDYSFASGQENNAEGSNSFASGFGNTAIGISSVSMGYYSVASAHYSVAIGLNAYASTRSYAIGDHAIANGSPSVVIGHYVQSNASRAFVIGSAANSSPLINSVPSSLMIGFESNFPTLFIGRTEYGNQFGKIGIGTIDPKATLEINGGVLCKGFAMPQDHIKAGYVLTTDGTGVGHWADSQLLGLWLPTESGDIYRPTGNVGIGMDNPLAKLEVKGQVSIGYHVNPALQENNLVVQGRVGIGTFSPSVEMEVVGKLKTTQLQILDGHLNGYILQCDNEGNASWINPTELNVGGWLQLANNVYVEGTRFVGIGTSTPTQPLDVVGNIKLSGDIFGGRTSEWPPLRIFAGTNENDGAYMLMSSSANQNGSIKFFARGAGGCVEFFNAERQIMSVKDNGNVYIGDPNNQSDLMVYGEIKAHLVRVTTDIPWFDYVFDKDYQLMPLHQLEAFVNEHHHLPDMPTEQQVHEEGLDIAQMNALLLKKVEELTLYVIELKKENEEIREEIIKLKN